MEIYPSLISSDLLNLEKTIRTFNTLAHGYHIDVMDNHFVPNLTWGPAFVNAISKATSLPLGVHLMVDDPGAWVEKLKLKPSDVFIFHYEALSDVAAIHSLVKKVKGSGIKVGMAINPKTEAQKIFEFLNELDEMLIMSVEPGFSGQSFITDVVDKLKTIIEFKKKEGLGFSVSMDGGIDENNIGMLSGVGVNGVAVASGIFHREEPALAFKNLIKRST